MPAMAYVGLCQCTSLPFNPADANYTYYVGNGAISSNYYMANYAGYSTANVRNLGNNGKANGKVAQQVVTLKKGLVSCFFAMAFTTPYRAAN